VTRQHFKLRVTREDFTEDKEKGIVLEQSPLAGTKLKEHHTVSVVISKGPAPRGVPDLTGADEAKATQLLQAAGLTVAPDVARPFVEDQAKGAVLDWSPKGVDVAKGTAVHLTVSAGPPQRSISDWRGKSFDDANAAIAKAGLVVQRNDVFDDTIPPGFVVSTNPPAKANVDKGSTVVVNVSKGPDLVQVPNVNGQTVDQATATMRSAGLSVGNVFGPPDKKVFTTDPPAGTSVKRGSSVNLYTK
jgi:serine/threonine-protein kinase